MQTLVELEPRLRHLLPASLYVEAWVDPSLDNLLRIFDHLIRLQFILYGYLPRHVSENPPQPGQSRFAWEEDTLLFTDLAGFSRLIEANAHQGESGARTLLDLLNRYLGKMIEILQQAGGILLEFTGDALLAEFRSDERQRDTLRAVRAGLRMQRAMQEFQQIVTPYGVYSFGMRVGIHRGRFLAADIGTPLRMEHVLLGETIRSTKQTESAGLVGRVCLTPVARAQVAEHFRFAAHTGEYSLVVDDLSDKELGNYDLFLDRRKLARPILADRSEAGVLQAITATLKTVEPLASFLPAAFLKLLIEQVAVDERSTRLVPAFPLVTILFVNLVGLPEAVDKASAADLPLIINTFAQMLARINAAVESRSGVLKKVTYHLAGSDLVIYFGVPHTHSDDPQRAAETALAIGQIVAGHSRSEGTRLTCHMGLTQGLTFAGEIGKAQGRREFNVLGPPVNLAARLMERAGQAAQPGQIYLNEVLHQALQGQFRCESLGEMHFKGKMTPTAVYALRGE
jgi:adenylate cyclase